MEQISSSPPTWLVSVIPSLLSSECMPWFLFRPHSSSLIWLLTISFPFSSSVSKPTLDLIVFNYQLGRSLGWGGVSGLFINYMLTGWILRQVTPAFGKLAAIEAKLEGDFRSAHSRIITNAEEIAFYNGAPIEASILNRAYLRLIRHVNSILKIRIAYSMTEDFVLKYAWSAAGYVIIASPFLFGNGAKDNIPRVDDARSELGLAVPGETREQKSNRSVSGATLKEVAAKTEGECDPQKRSSALETDRQVLCSFYLQVTSQIVVFCSL